MTVDAAETRITDAGEVARWMADAAPTWTANIGWNVLYSSRGIGGYRNNAAVDYWKGEKLLTSQSF